MLSKSLTTLYRFVIDGLGGTFQNMENPSFFKTLLLPDATG
jgi:hypothetical protein